MNKSIKVDQGTVSFLNRLFTIIAPATNTIHPGCFSCDIVKPGRTCPFATDQREELAVFLRDSDVLSAAMPNQKVSDLIERLNPDNILSICYEIWPAIMKGCEFDLDEDEHLVSIRCVGDTFTFKFVTQREAEVKIT